MRAGIATRAGFDLPKDTRGRWLHVVLPLRKLLAEKAKSHFSNCISIGQIWEFSPRLYLARIFLEVSWNLLEVGFL